MKHLILFILIILSSLGINAQNCNNNTIVGDEIPRHPETPNNFPPEIPSTVPFLPRDTTIRDTVVKVGFFIHGIGGNDTSLKNASDMSQDRQPNFYVSDSLGYTVYVNDLINFPARQMVSANPGYGTGLQIDDYGADILDQMSATFNDQFAQDTLLTFQERVQYAKANNFCIAHSMGGINTRMAEIITINNPDLLFPAGGIATLSTPHHGAILADNVLFESFGNNTSISYDFEAEMVDLNGSAGSLLVTTELRNFLEEAAFALVEGPKVAAIQESFILKLLKDKVDDVVEFFVDEIINLIPTLGANFASKTVLNLQTDDLQLNFVHQTPTPTQKVAFYGIEDEDLTLWKMAFWLTNDPNAVPYAISNKTMNEGYFSAGSDKIGVLAFEDNLAKYEMKFNSSQTQYNQYNNQVNSWHCNINPFCFVIARIKRAEWEKSMDAWELGVDWWNNSTEYWDLLTGARTVEPTITSTTTSYCVCYDPNFDLEDTNLYVYNSVNCVPFKPTDICNQVTNTITTIEEIYKPNDGVVLNESAMDYIGVLEGNVLPLDGSNHFQMRNDAALQDALMFLYDNNRASLSSFRTPVQTF